MLDSHCDKPNTRVRSLSFHHNVATNKQKEQFPVIVLNSPPDKLNLMQTPTVAGETKLGVCEAARSASVLIGGLSNTKAADQLHSVL